jgi:hypothetical protein
MRKRKAATVPEMLISRVETPGITVHIKKKRAQTEGVSDKALYSSLDHRLPLQGEIF